MSYWIKQAYAYPERLALLPDENGRPLMSRVPGHPTRPAREGEAGWWQPIDPSDVRGAIDAGHSVATEAALRKKWGILPAEAVRESLRRATLAVEAREAGEREARARRGQFQRENTR